jgi:anthranilate phosphoribosyltransferase
MTTSVTFATLYQKLSGPTGPAPELVRAGFDAILAGQWTPVQVAGFLVALRAHGDSAACLLAAAEAMRANMVVVDHGLDLVLDTCGTGGDGQGTLNLSTGAALLAAASGIRVAKHGNRAVSSHAGSADVIEALGVRLDVAPAHAATVLREAGIAFLMAPAHHPAMRHAVVARRELGIRTVFNAVGPLANPARATHQLVGTYDDGLRPMFAEVLQQLGTKRAWVVHGREGLDEISPFGPTRVTSLDRGSTTEFEVAPEDFGVTPSAPGAIAGGDAAANATVLENILRGAPHPATDAVVLNAAAALVVAHEQQPKAATARVRELIASGAAHRALEAWRAITRSLAPEKAGS